MGLEVPLFQTKTAKLASTQEVQDAEVPSSMAGFFWSLFQAHRAEITSLSIRGEFRKDSHQDEANDAVRAGRGPGGRANWLPKTLWELDLCSSPRRHTLP